MSSEGRERLRQDDNSDCSNGHRNSNENFSESANGERSSEAPSSDPVGSAEYETGSADLRDSRLPATSMKSSENVNDADQDGETTKTIMDTKLMSTCDNVNGSTAFHFGDIVRDVITQSSTKFISGKQTDQSAVSRSQSPSRSPVSIMLTSANPDCDEKAEVTVEVNNPDAVVDRMIKTLAAKFHPESVVTIGCGMGTCNATCQSFSAAQQYDGMGSGGYFGGGRLNTAAGFSTTASSGYRMNPSQAMSQNFTQYSNSPLQSASPNYAVSQNSGTTYSALAGMSNLNLGGNAGQYMQSNSTVEKTNLPSIQQITQAGNMGGQKTSSRIQVNTLPGVLLADTERSSMRTTTQMGQGISTLPSQGGPMTPSSGQAYLNQGFKTKFGAPGTFESSRTETVINTGSPTHRHGTSISLNGAALPEMSGQRITTTTNYSQMPSTQFQFGATEGAYSGQALGPILEGHIASSRSYAGDRLGSGRMGNYENVVAERFVSSTNIAEEYLTPQMNTNEEQITYVEVPMVQEVIREVVRKEYVEVEKRVPKIEIEYVDRIVEIPDVQWVDKQVEVPRVHEVIREVKTKQYVDRPREVIRTVPKIEVRQVEKIVEVPQIVERPVPVAVEERIDIATFIDSEVATVVAQSMTPIIGESGETIELEMTDYEPVLIAVEVPIPVPVSITHGAAVRVNTVHNVVNIHAEQFNALLRVANEKVIAQYGEQVIPWFTEMGSGNRLMLPVRERVEIVTPVSNEWMSQHVAGQIHVVQQGVVQMDVAKRLQSQVYMNGVNVGSQAAAMAQLNTMTAQAISQSNAVMAQSSRTSTVQQYSSAGGMSRSGAWSTGGMQSGNLRAMNYGMYKTTGAISNMGNLNNMMSSTVGSLMASTEPYEATMAIETTTVTSGGAEFPYPAIRSNIVESTGIMSSQSREMSNSANQNAVAPQKLRSLGTSSMNSGLPGVFLGEAQQSGAQNPSSVLGSNRTNQASMESKSRTAALSNDYTSQTGQSF